MKTLSDIWHNQIKCAYPVDDTLDADFDAVESMELLEPVLFCQYMDEEYA